MSPADQPTEVRPLRLLTWNIHGFVGEGRRPDPDRTLRVVEASGADVAALQEVDGRVRFGRLPRAFERLAEGLGGYVCEARLFGEPGREYGHILWSRYPLRGEIVPLPGPGLEPRAAIRAAIETPTGELRIIAAHLGLRPQARRNGAEAMATLAGNRPCVVMGDLNEWRVRGGVDRRLRDVLPDRAVLPSWPAGRPAVPLDRIYAGGGARILAARTLPESRFASDHLALLAEVAF